MMYLYQIIDYRYTHGLQTIVTTNARDLRFLVNRARNEQNAETMGAIVSRLLGFGETVAICEAEDQRTGKK